jgi:ABC-type multidrug transport system fused ATPase/permease subunit
MDMDEHNKGIRISPHDIKGKVEFRNVWFRYPTRKEEFVLRGLNLEIEPGESVALVGESGCGKSTFINMLMRFYDPEFGEVLLDDVNIKEYNLHDLRKAISLVMQEPIVFNYSILENVLYGKTDATNTEVQKACEQANCMEFINKADFSAQKDDSAEALLKEFKTYSDQIIAIVGKEKYDEELAVLEKCKAQEERKGTFVAHEGDVDQRDKELKDMEMSKGYDITAGIRGGKLSGGQKQRVAIARTIIRQPKVLMLDEATSALDEDAQKKVQAALNEAMKGKTVIIIAHRMSTIEGCDKIFVLEYGKVAEEGTMAKLKSQGGHFAKMEAKSK